MSVSPGESRLRGLTRSLSALRESVCKVLLENSHLTLADALEYARVASPEFSEEIAVLSKRIEGSMCSVMSRATGRPVDDPKELDSVLLDCFEAIDRSLDAMAGRAPAFIPDVPPRKKFEAGRFDAPNALYPSDRTVFSRASNPFEKVINALSFQEHCSDTEQHSATVRPGSITDVPCKLVETERDLHEMIRRLEGEPIVGVDLENHSYYSYQGFSCLLQLSGHDTDYLVDTIKLKTELRSCLPRVLSNPNILKILHGSEHDSLWLQRDFDCFLVCVFDTLIAAKQLDLKKQSLGGLLQFYFSLHLDKQYQLADWRVRPLPADMLRYARLDTHYLLPLFARMKRHIVDSLGMEALHQTFLKSSQQCLRLYSPQHDDGSEQGTKCRSLAAKSGSTLDIGQMQIVQAIYKWRAETAREHDVCLHAVLPDHWIVRLAVNRPSSVDDLKRSLCEGYTQFVDKHSLELVGLLWGKDVAVAGRQIKPEPAARKLVRCPVSVAAPTVAGPFSSIMRPPPFCPNPVLLVPEMVAPVPPSEEAVEEAVEESNSNVVVQDQDDTDVVNDGLLHIIESNQFSMTKASIKVRKPVAVDGNLDISEKASSLYGHGAGETDSGKAQKSGGTDSNVKKHVKRKQSKGQYVISQIQKK